MGEKKEDEESEARRESGFPRPCREQRERERERKEEKKIVLQKTKTEKKNSPAPGERCTR